MRKHILALLALLLLTAPAQASEVTIGWDPNPVGEGVTGYTAHVSTISQGPIEIEVDAGNVTEVVVTVPRLRGTYFFRVTAYNAAGLRSDYSDEVSKDFTAEWDAVVPPTRAGGVGVLGSVF